LTGDINIAHTEWDIKNWKGNRKSAGFLPEERAYLDRLMEEHGWVDVHRTLHGDGPGPYTWWSQRGKAFDNDAGWRIDYQIPAPPPSRSTDPPATPPAGRITPPCSSATPDRARVLPARRHRAPDATTPRPDLSGRGAGQNRACRCGQRGLARDLRRGRGSQPA